MSETSVKQSEGRVQGFTESKKRGEKINTHSYFLIMAIWRALPTARAMANEEFTRLWLSNDHREAEAAFVEKRKPNFTGE